jgi:hypothetical protein
MAELCRTEKHRGLASTCVRKPDRARRSHLLRGLTACFLNRYLPDEQGRGFSWKRLVGISGAKGEKDASGPTPDLSSSVVEERALISAMRAFLRDMRAFAPLDLDTPQALIRLQAARGPAGR